jgi:murein DD-endopeptidase MepM/ murein hydrolase activator NlpD
MSISDQEESAKHHAETASGSAESARMATVSSPTQETLYPPVLQANVAGLLHHWPHSPALIPCHTPDRIALRVAYGTKVRYEAPARTDSATFWESKQAASAKDAACRMSGQTIGKSPVQPLFFAVSPKRSERTSPQRKRIGLARIIHWFCVAKEARARQVGPRVAKSEVAGTGVPCRISKKDGTEAGPEMACTRRLQQKTHVGLAGPLRTTRLAIAWLLPLLVLTVGVLARATALEFFDACSNDPRGSDPLNALEPVSACPVDSPFPAGPGRVPQDEHSGLGSSESGAARRPHAQCDWLAEPPSGEESEPASEGFGGTFKDSVAREAGQSTALHVSELRHRIQSGETISDVLESAGADPGQVDEWVRATKQVYDLNRIGVGQELSLAVDMRSNTLLHLALEIDPKSLVVVERQDGSVVASRKPIRHYRRVRVVSGTIDSSLYAAAVAEGLPQKIISDVAKILSGELNLSRDLRAGASFRVAYEELMRYDATPPIPGRVLAVEITNRGRSHEAFYFATPEGTQSGYYDRRGEALGLAFLRYPVAFSRISSGFSKGRFHPILKRRAPHYGVDFAASRGTPVKAIADGTVRKAAWNCKDGLFVTIRHDAVYKSGYAHLSRIASGIKPGVFIKQGQVLGYVGSTGRATGPHLHFSISRGGRYIDPLTAALPRSRPLSGSALAAFRTTIARIDAAYAQAGSGPESTMRLAKHHDSGDVDVQLTRNAPDSALCSPLPISHQLAVAAAADTSSPRASPSGSLDDLLLSTPAASLGPRATNLRHSQRPPR